MLDEQFPECDLSTLSPQVQLVHRQYKLDTARFCLTQLQVEAERLCDVLTSRGLESQWSCIMMKRLIPKLTFALVLSFCISLHSRVILRASIIKQLRVENHD